jgi:hypothetical protein
VRPGTSGRSEARPSHHDPDGAPIPNERNASKELRLVGRVRAAQQRARSRGDPATTKPRATPFTRDVVYEAAHVCFERHNDIEFSGERKRVRCNELLGGDERPH